MIPVIGLAVVIFWGAVQITGRVRRFALKHQLLDIPNRRSSHTVPTPRGGGLGIVATFLPAAALLMLTGLLSIQVGAALFCGGLIIAVVGYCDDRFRVPASRRLLVHFLAAGGAVAWMGGIPPLRIMTWTVQWGWFGHLAGVIGLVWLINLYNFMDGIDGIAGSEAVFVSGVGGIFLWLDGCQELAIVTWSLTAACLGFLYWNWPPAKIFMGDIGSGFLGYTLGILAMSSARENESSLWIWFLLLSVFIVDATVTLLRRLIRGEQCFEAHRSHAYQHATTRYGRHLSVTLGVLGINGFGLLPLALVAWKWPGTAPFAAGAAVILLTILAIRFNAGVEDKPVLPVQNPSP